MIPLSTEIFQRLPPLIWSPPRDGSGTDGDVDFREHLLEGLLRLAMEKAAGKSDGDDQQFAIEHGPVEKVSFTCQNGDVQ